MGASLLRLPHPQPRRAQIDADLDLPVRRLFVAHGVEALVQIGQQPQAVWRDKPVGLDARLVLVKPHIRVQPRHAHIHAGLAVDVAGVILAKAGFQQHVFGEFDHVDVVVRAAGHGVVVGKNDAKASGTSAGSY